MNFIMDFIYKVGTAFMIEVLKAMMPMFFVNAANVIKNLLPTAMTAATVALETLQKIMSQTPNCC